MCCSPRLYTSFRNFVTFREIVQILEYIRYIHDLLNSLSNSFFKICFIFFLNNKYDFLKSCAFCIKDREIHNNMSFLIYRVNLLQPAISASHSCCHNDQNRFLHNEILQILLNIMLPDGNYISIV